jgi:2-polyprenyl-6-methoxyphenol hydroxylase-like FAD-dependent oxidoreductase
MSIDSDRTGPRNRALFLPRQSDQKSNWSKGRIALIGDAAFCVSLLAGHGSALAMISAYVLAYELAQVGGRYQQAFPNYEARLPTTRWGLCFRNQVIRAFAIPGLARLAIGREIIDTLRVPG